MSNSLLQAPPFCETVQSVAESNRVYLRHCPENDNFDLDESIAEINELAFTDKFLEVNYVQSCSHLKSSTNEDHRLYQHIEVSTTDHSVLLRVLLEFMKNESFIFIENEETTLYLIGKISRLICRICTSGKVFYGTQHFVRSFTADVATVRRIFTEYQWKMMDTQNQKTNFDTLCNTSS